MAASSNTKNDAVQSQILQAARQLFQAHGIEKITMDDVASAIGRQRSSLYYYYKSKEEIVAATFSVEKQQIIAELSEAISKAKTVEEKITMYCITRLKISLQRKAFNKMIDGSLNAGTLSTYIKEKRARHEQFRQHEVSLLRALFISGIKSGQLRKMSKQEQDDVIMLILFSIQGLKKEVLAKENVRSVRPAVLMLSSLIADRFRK